MRVGAHCRRVAPFSLLNSFTMQLNVASRARIQAVSVLMLHPNVHQCVGDYLAAVGRSLCPLLQPDVTISIARGAETPEFAQSDVWSGATLAGFARATRSAAKPLVHVLTAEVSRYRLGSSAGNAGKTVLDWYRDHGVIDVLRFRIIDPSTCVSVIIEFQALRVSGRLLSTSGERLMRLLLPSLISGVSRLAFRSRVAPLFDQLAALGVPIAFCATSGAIVRQSASLDALLASEQQSQDVTKAVLGLVRTAGDCRARGGVPVAGPRECAATVTTTLRRYELRATFDPQGSAGGVDAILVVVTAFCSLSPTPDELVRRFRMSPREVEVAILLSRGSCNTVIASQLSISPHTAKRHTERVFAKLGVTSRSRAMALLLASGLDEGAVLQPPVAAAQRFSFADSFVPGLIRGLI